MQPLKKTSKRQDKVQKKMRENYEKSDLLWIIL